MTPIEREALPSEILARLTETDKRLIVAIAGPPGAGKSTISDYLLHAINKGGETPSIVVPMDGFHLDDGILDQRGLLGRKGSPPTFDCAGFAVLLQRLKQAEAEVFIPVFDRSLELSRAAASVVGPEHRVLLVEGNYLLLDQQPWAQLAPFFDMTLYLDVPFAELERRLIERWLSFGFDAETARNRALSNDIPNAELVVAQSRKADFVVVSDGR
ncbi:nucleoside/nucleotide kinase family protein [Brucella anthropi]|jgi:pantothenate kinase|uniref:Nucleoside/nucleotide kinase family protein n=1 Tax=Brucella anthropi TaxID=529 RepID=A0A011UNU7_BRUAN|nr:MULTISPECIES: nucleoside/nucleotide kinase family protein [Brucella/Ochrobactrum group]QTN01717.1 nucleoside/nucleotide kinase family protein [Ochrobactrum sp. EEELCW01]EXL07568.1 nucleoside triphosphate hydrolase [Brucella anthropi]KAB2741163.1 nucleoside/nucleotide kinase family protein [Brucella anthropi]KAB2759068.1 nucleoside/nucleotide kinase family protein [Brucella anthropi]KAB2768700.1 nucleoside/nucleotide kinase family protein [Brucella anthropi]